MFDKELLIKAMEEHNFTAYKLWKSSNVAQSTISTILSGHNTNPSSKTLEKLALSLDVPMSSFFTDESNDCNENNNPENEPNFNNSVNALIAKLNKSGQNEESKNNCLEMINKINESFFKSGEYNEETKKDMLDYITELFWKNKLNVK